MCMCVCRKASSVCMWACACTCLMFVRVCVHVCLICVVEWVHTQGRCPCLVRTRAHVCIVSRACICACSWSAVQVCVVPKQYVYAHSTCVYANDQCTCVRVSGVCVCVREHTSAGVCHKDPLENATQSSAGAGLAFTGRTDGLGSLPKAPRTGELPRTSEDIKATCQSPGHPTMTVNRMLSVFGGILLLRTVHTAGTKYSWPMKCLAPPPLKEPLTS